MDPAEVEFIAEKEVVSIIPNFAMEEIYMIGGNFGPFRPGLPTPVPLWMAISLKQRQKCRIVAPEWMDVEHLTEKKQQEQEAKTFTAMPSKHYLEVSQLLLQSATDDIPRADEVKTLIKDIWDMRMAKLRSSIDGLVKKGEETVAQVDHLTLMEINTVRPFLTTSLNLKHQLQANFATANPSE